MDWRSHSRRAILPAPPATRRPTRARVDWIIAVMKPVVMILCGGRGTRLQERTQLLPKPLVEIGGRPIVWHVIQIYLAQGFHRFLLLTGYRAELIEQFVTQTSWPDAAEIECLDTGLDTPTGGRIHAAASLLGPDRFCATYADAVADIDLHALLASHQRGGTLGPVTRAPPARPFASA